MNQVVKGVALAAFVAFASLYLNQLFAWSIGFDKSPVSSIIIAIVLGIVLNNAITLPTSFSSGFDFSLKYILKLGIILLGIRLSLVDVFNLASSVLPLIIVCIFFTLVATYFIAKKCHIDDKFSFLTAVGVSICGVTAIVATSPVIHANKEQTSYAIANITIFGIIAMLLYPFIAHISFSTTEQIGYFLGTAVHETSQVAGAGLIYAQQFAEETVLDIAMVTKLLRNSFMLLVIPIIALIYHKNAMHQQAKISIIKIFPYFILGFLVIALLRTMGDNYINDAGTFLFFDQASWLTLIKYIKSSAEICLTIAMACVGLTTNLKSMIALGLKPFYIGLTVSSITGLISWVVITQFYM